MSSILDALKKAEQESNSDRSAGTPWPAQLPEQSPSRRRSRRWWVPLGIVVGLCVSGAVFWQVWQPGITPPADSMSAAPSQPLPKTTPSLPTPVAEATKPSVPVAEQPQVPPTKTLTDVSPRQATGNVPASEVHVLGRKVVPAPVQPQKQPPRAAIPPSDPMLAPAVEPTRLPMDSSKATGQPKPAPPDTGRFFKNDPRIELQALVWAPESAARFVVINNRLIKEGGSVDNIVVVQINPDDVLLAEGSDRWHEAFKIR